VVAPPIGSKKFPKAAFFVQKAYTSLCAFAINEDGADTLSFAPAPFQNFWIRHALSVLYNFCFWRI